MRFMTAADTWVQAAPAPPDGYPVPLPAGLVHAVALDADTTVCAVQVDNIELFPYLDFERTDWSDYDAAVCPHCLQSARVAADA